MLNPYLRSPCYGQNAVRIDTRISIRLRRHQEGEELFAIRKFAVLMTLVGHVRGYLCRSIRFISHWDSEHKMLKFRISKLSDNLLDDLHNLDAPLLIVQFLPHEHRDDPNMPTAVYLHGNAESDNAVGHVTLTSMACHESCRTGTLAFTPCYCVCSSVSQGT